MIGVLLNILLFARQVLHLSEQSVLFRLLALVFCFFLVVLAVPVVVVWIVVRGVADYMIRRKTVKFWQKQLTIDDVLVK